MDTTREELPDTMAAIRLSGMEISDLTTELSDLGLHSFFFFLSLNFISLHYDYYYDFLADIVF